MNGPNTTCAACGTLIGHLLSPFCLSCEPTATTRAGATSAPAITPEMIERAYRALTPSTPEPIRALVLELAWRIA